MINIPKQICRNLAFMYPYRGFSLTELLISLAVGIVVVTGVIAIYASSVQSNVSTLNTIRLNQELRAAMDIMTRDIRRAGFRGNTVLAAAAGVQVANTTANEFTTPINDLEVGSIAPGVNNCIAYSYDFNNNSAGGLDNADRRGFRRNVDGGRGVIVARNGGGAAVNCAFPSAQPITDPALVDITTLTFTLAPVCPYTAATPGVVSLLSSVVPTYRVIRTVGIILAGRLVSDPTVTRTLTELVRIQNDRIVITPGGVFPPCL